MKELFTAIMTKFSGSLLETTLTGGLWFEQAEQNTTAPYGVFHHISNSLIGVMGFEVGTHIEDTIIQFSLFDSHISAVRICDLYRELIELYDGCNLTILDYDHIIMKRESSNLFRVDDFWQYSCDFQIIVQDR